MSAHLGAWVLGLVMGVRGVAGGYLSLNMTPATQCGVSTVRWSGDDGPYHLLLTPTQHVEHGYNVWLPSIPDGTNSYNLSINQPEGSHFLLTMWGASGISYAGTTDVNSVGAPHLGADDSCFLSDAEILALYSFSFNITDGGNDFPPQCSDLTLSWPTSLDQNVTGYEAQASASVYDTDNDNDGETPSSSKHPGNTTYPPTLFGVIPLGNSFSIPITYAEDSPFADSLPASSLSQNPTTWTSHGTTALNWTIDMAKGTRFILVAGIGSNSQWASGGSSELMTVGQGSTGCIGSEQSGGNGPPKVTATGSTDTPTSTSPSDQETSASSSSSKGSSVARTVIACVISVLGTLIIIGLLVFCYRIRRKRRLAAQDADCGSGSPRKPSRAGTANTKFDSDSQYPMDLVSSPDRGEVPEYTPTAGPSSPLRTRPSFPWYNPDHAPQLRPALTLDPSAPIRGFEPGTITTGTYSSPISPMGTTIFAGASAESSQDALLQKSNLQSPLRTNPPSLPIRRSTALQLHNRENSESVDSEENAEELADLKLETLAAVEGGQGEPGTPSRERRRRRPRDDGAETEYVVHRDAGRVPGPRQETPRRRVELPPRYDQLELEEGEEARRDNHAPEEAHTR